MSNLDGSQIKQTVKVGDFEVTELPSFPPNSNPFHYDAFNMGTGVGDEVEVMWGLPSATPPALFVVHKPTGKRLLVRFPKA